jgi:23S rRNA pseudouridine1911/1915/1917 synthase
MVVHPARGNWTGTLTSALAFRFQSLTDIGGPTRPGIVHRLDRDTSGVIVVAKTNAFHLHLAEQWHERDVKKEYLAITAGILDRDRDMIDAPIGRHPFQRDKMAIRERHETSRPAKTFYEVLARWGRYSLVKAMPVTGRTHQIRVHLEHVGCPVLCDRLYGGHSQISRSQLLGKKTQPGEMPALDRHALHASRLTLTHPKTKQVMEFYAPLPADMERTIAILRETEKD